MLGHSCIAAYSICDYGTECTKKAYAFKEEIPYTGRDGNKYSWVE